MPHRASRGMAPGTGGGAIVRQPRRSQQFIGHRCGSPWPVHVCAIVGWPAPLVRYSNAQRRRFVIGPFCPMRARCVRNAIAVHSCTAAVRRPWRRGAEPNACVSAMVLQLRHPHVTWQCRIGALTAMTYVPCGSISRESVESRESICVGCLMSVLLRIRHRGFFDET